MPGATSEPSVTLSFANNFWGKDDAGVSPLLQRMHDAKTTCEELKAFYTARATIEDEYARKLLSLSKKPLGSCESGSLKTSMDVLKTEVELMAKAHQNIAGQMKTELEEPLAAFSGGMRERRKIIQGGCEKILKLKMQQTQQVNKTRDRYEQDCLKIKGYLAQGHMVMGQEERKNKARLEKTQAALAGSNADYEAAIKALEETTLRWNRDWKNACDKFQDLEEERIDFIKSSLWSFANISSTVCVSDDESCEKVRISLENCEVEKDITSFIKDKGTGQEIPDPPKYINFSRGDLSDDSSSETPEDNYSVAAFPRAGNPTYRSSSPNPSTTSSQPLSPQASEPLSRTQSKPSPEPQSQSQQSQSVRSRESDRRGSDRRGGGRRESRRRTMDPQSPPIQPDQATLNSQRSRGQYALSQQQPPSSSTSRSQRHERQAVQNAPHNEYPLDGMTMYCRPGNMISDTSSTSPSVRPSSSHESGSEYSNLTSVSGSSENSGTIRRGGTLKGSRMPQQQISHASSREEEKQVQKRKSGFFSNGGPFRRKSKSEKEHRQQQQLQQQQQAQQQQLALQEQRRMEQQQQQAQMMRPMSSNNRNTWSQSAAHRNSASQNNPQYGSSGSRNRQPQLMFGNARHESPEPIDPRASLALNIGGNVFDVSTPEVQDNSRQNSGSQPKQPEDEGMDLDPIAQALAELKGVTKGAANRNSADRFFGLATPAPSATPGPGNSTLTAAQRGTPPPNYATKSALDLPPPAFTSAQMQQTTQRYINQRDNMLDGPPQMPAALAENRSMNGRQRSKTLEYQRTMSRQSSRETSGSRQDIPRATSPAPPMARSVSPRPQLYGDGRYGSVSPKPSVDYSNRGPSPNPYTQSRPGTSNSNMQYTAYSQRSASPLPSGQEVALSTYRAHSPAPSQHSRHDSYNSRSRSRAGSIRGNGYDNQPSRNSYYGGSDNGQAGALTYQGSNGTLARPRSKSVVDTTRQYSRDGRPIIHYARAMYMYNAAIPEELTFAKGDILAILREQDDGWWEAEIVGVPGRTGLVPSNYLQNC